MIVLSAVWLLFRLFILYTLGWFLLSAFLFLVSRGKTPAMTFPAAAVLGGMSALAHIIVRSLINLGA
jgi:hypothetical protein